MRVTVKRLKKSYPQETLSEVLIDDEFFCYGMEQPWNDNKPFESRVPDGVYNLRAFNSQKYGNTYCIYNPHLGVTPTKSNDIYLGYNRFACLIHSANWAYQLQGCLALGKDVIDQEDKHMITSSRETVQKFFTLLQVFMDENDALPKDIMIEFISE